MSAKLTWEKITLNLRNPFRLSYGTSETRQAFWLRLREDEGWGEGTIPPYYGVQTQDMERFWQQAAENPAPFPDEVEQIPEWVGEAGPAPARCAVDLALHDRLARQRQIPLYRLLGLPRPEQRTSSFTISLNTPAEMAAIALKVAAYPIIKVKLGGDDQDLARLAAIREARPDVHLWVDANAGWSLDEARRLLPDLEALNLEMLEQPLPKTAIKGLGQLQNETRIPIVADESVQTLADVAALAQAGVGGVNIKLMKAGGITPALEMIRLAKASGMGVMLGCMIETSLGVTAMAHLSGLADWLDLDASILISNDPFEGMRLDETCQIVLPDRAGIGVRLNS